MFSISAGVMKLQTKRCSNVFLLALVSTKKDKRSRTARTGKIAGKVATGDFISIGLKCFKAPKN